jgi:hypothetical protein
MTSADRETCAAMAALLHAGLPLAFWNVGALTAACWVLWTSGGTTAPWLRGLAALSLALGFAALWLAFRVRLDAKLFEALSHGRIGTLESLDTSLQTLGLRRRPPGAARPLADRLAGARALLVRHALLTLLHTLCLAALLAPSALAS